MRPHPVGNAAVPEPAKPVDLKRYLGKWYEIARYDQRFQKGCEGVSATYSMADDGLIKVINACRKPGGKRDIATGKAKIVDPESNAKLKVSFFGSFWGDYWVLDHGENYQWAIVGEPSGRYLWLLSREAVPPKAERDGLIARSAALGYDTTMLRITRQP